LEPREILDRKKLHRDTRPGAERAAIALEKRKGTLVCLCVFILFGTLFPVLALPCFGLSLLAFGLHWRSIIKEPLPFRYPICLEVPDPHSPTPGHTGLNQAEGIVFLGNESSTGKELWLEKKDVLTHMLVMGTTGSGKSAALVSLAFNALSTGSGIFYIDPKAASQLSMEIWQISRLAGREDDFRVLNYATAMPPDPTKRISNTNNPFSMGSADGLTQILGSLMPPSTGGNSIFADKALTLMQGLMYALTELRDSGHVPLSPKVIRHHLNAKECLKLLKDERISEASRASLKAALLSCNFVDRKDEPDKQPQAFYEQFGYAQSYFGKAISSLTDTYEHIYGVCDGEVDFKDTVLNRRILLTLLPSMEKSPLELASLGKITLSSLRAAAAVGLGLEVEGRENDVLSALPITFVGTGPFLSIVDEYAAIVTPGFEMLLTQGRGLGMATIVASQDYAGIVEADPKGAQQIVANTNVKVFMKLAEAEKTWNLLRGLSGEETVVETTGYNLVPGAVPGEGAWADNASAHPVNRGLAALKDLLDQNEGEAHCLMGGLFTRARLFHAGPKLKGAVMRIPRLLEMPLEGPGEKEEPVEPVL
jgi:intracellular multiplication protein IcmO